MAITDNQFASGVNDAIQAYTDYVTTSREIGKFIGPDIPERGPYRNTGEYADMVRTIMDTPVFWWQKSTGEAVARASESYPVAPRMYLPQLAHAFVMFEGPTISARIDGKDVWFSGLNWRGGVYVNHGGALAIDVYGLVWVPPRVLPVWWATIGGTWVPEMKDDTFAEERTRLLKWILAASMFVEQRIIVSSPERPSRAFAKRVERVAHEPVCHVVTLRRADRRDERESTGEQGVDWQCQWIVRGHWRNQYYPKADRHVPVFIEPYVKGPEDKPLKAPKPAVFNVSR